MQTFGHDRVLLYNVDPWSRLGFGVPAFHENVGTLSIGLHNLADEIGTLQLYIMTHVDAMRTQPPSRNTVARLGKMLNRVQSVLGGRAKNYSEIRTEEGHASPTPYIWTVHPVPFFNSALVRNHWLREYNQLCMIALSNFFQHSDNNLALTITTKFTQDIWQYFNDVKLLLGSELLQISRVDLDAPGFVFNNSHYDTYSPEDITINIEAIDTPGPIFSLPTEDDLRPLLRGIPANLISPNLSQYPIGPVPDAEGIAGVDIPTGQETFGTKDADGSTGEAIGPPDI